MHQRWKTEGHTSHLLHLPHQAAQVSPGRKRRKMQEEARRAQQRAEQGKLGFGSSFCRKILLMCQGLTEGQTRSFFSTDTHTHLPTWKSARRSHGTLYPCHSPYFSLLPTCLLSPPEGRLLRGRDLSAICVSLCPSTSVLESCLARLMHSPSFGEALGILAPLGSLLFLQVSTSHNLLLCKY